MYKNTTATLLYESSSAIYYENLAGTLYVSDTNFLNNTSLLSKNNIYAYTKEVSIGFSEF
jgi:hypothetical protein